MLCQPDTTLVLIALASNCKSATRLSSVCKRFRFLLGSTFWTMRLEMRLRVSVPVASGEEYWKHLTCGRVRIRDRLTGSPLHIHPQLAARKNIAKVDAEFSALYTVAVTHDGECWMYTDREHHIASGITDALICRNGKGIGLVLIESGRIVCVFGTMRRERLCSVLVMMRRGWPSLSRVGDSTSSFVTWPLATCTDTTASGA
jgi:hypothetical protein